MVLLLFIELTYDVEDVTMNVVDVGFARNATHFQILSLSFKKFLNDVKI